LPVLILKALDCETTEDTSGADSCRLDISVDGSSPWVLRRDVNSSERWQINRRFSFANTVQVELFDEDSLDADDFLGRVVIVAELKPRATAAFTLDGARYVLWYEVLDPASGIQLGTISLRQMLGRMGRGVLAELQYQELIGHSAIYQCEELISIRDVMRLHAAQDRGKGATGSLRTWIERHCNPWGEGSVIPVSDLPEGSTVDEIALGAPGWVAVENERTRVVAGLQRFSRSTDTDNPIAHETMDWNWDVVLDPAFSYMLAYTAKRIPVPGGIDFPILHNEWEMGSLPIQWRPFWGQYVSVWGRHIFDVGHMPVTSEIHPAHTIVREHTTAAPLGAGGVLVPANRAVIGMGFSGGFPGNVGSRWDDETGGIPSGISGDTTDCWATNLKRHPLRCRIFPPVPRPSATAALNSRVVLAELIQVPTFDRVDDFLELCQTDSPASGGDGLGFREWDRSAGLPEGFTPQPAPAQLRPQLVARQDSSGNDAFVEVTMDLNAAPQIPVGYHAIVECGWSLPGPHRVRGFDLTFERVKVITINDPFSNDGWHLYYGVNGQWAAWYPDDLLEEGRTYDIGKHFRVFTVDDQPIVIRDCGIEWQGRDFGNDLLRRVEITAPGPDHFGQIRADAAVAVVLDGNPMRFRAWSTVREAEDTPKHVWTIQISRFL
jgi:hypothetical protein